jgi:hypothetical protein
MKYYIDVVQRGISTTKEMEANSLDELLEQINQKIMGRLEYQIFSGKPYTFDNLVYTHHSENFWRE